MNPKRALLALTYNALKTSGLFSRWGAAEPYATILMYHRVNDTDPSLLTTHPAVFEEILAILKAEYQVVPLSDLVSRLAMKLPIAPQTVVITFDDGYRDNLLFAAPLLQKYALPATFFVTSGYIGTKRIFPWDNLTGGHHFPVMDWDEVRELSRMGFAIGAHTVNHVDLGQAPLDEARREIFQCKLSIEEQIAKPIVSFAYPFGKMKSIRPEILPVIAEAGFSHCCSGYGGKVHNKSNVFNLCRVPIYPTALELCMEIDNFMTYFDGRMRIHLMSNERGTIVL
jgi:peptidoglycan/xylan/chitin deacetylase (PgdA/CDA1 family)